jgi:integrase
MANLIRGKNEGTLHQRENGTWRAQISLQGRRLSFTAKTRRECQEWIKGTIRQVDEGMVYESSRVVLEDYIQGWLANVKVSRSKNTWQKYEQSIRSYIIPKLGKVKIKDLRPDQVQALYNQLLDHDAGAYTVIKIHTILHGALEQAVRTGLIARNPVHYCQPPKEPVNEMVVLSDSQVSQFLLIAKGHRWDALYNLALTTGMRQMELLGLKWTDLDWIRQTLRVERQLMRQEHATIEFSTLKTRYSRRSIALGLKTVESLRMHQERQQSDRITAGDRWVETGLIFTSQVGTPIHYRNLLRDFKALLKDAGLPPIRFHDLRHTAASLMLNAGIPAIVVSRRLGHARASITLDVYGHLIPSMQEEVADQIDDLVMPVELKPSAPNCTRSAPDLPSDHGTTWQDPHI